MVSAFLNEKCFGMPRRAVSNREGSGVSFDGSSSEVEERPAAGMSVRPEGPGETNRNDRKPWTLCALSVICSTATLAACGVFCALLYPIIEELRAERVRGEDGTEERMLGFWSTLMLSVSAGCICCAFSWTLTYVDSYQPRMDFPTALTPSHFRHISGHGYHMGYTVAVLNGLMAMLTVIWSLT